MKEPFFILKSIALFVALMWGMSLPCIADKKPIPTIDPIELEGINDETGECDRECDGWVCYGVNEDCSWMN